MSFQAFDLGYVPDSDEEGGTIDVVLEDGPTSSEVTSAADPDASASCPAWQQEGAERGAKRSAPALAAPEVGPMAPAKLLRRSEASNSSPPTDSRHAGPEELSRSCQSRPTRSRIFARALKKSRLMDLDPDSPELQKSPAPERPSGGQSHRNIEKPKEQLPGLGVGSLQRSNLFTIPEATGMLGGPAQEFETPPKTSTLAITPCLETGTITPAGGNATFPDKTMHGPSTCTCISTSTSSCSVAMATPFSTFTTVNATRDGPAAAATKETAAALSKSDLYPKVKEAAMSESDGTEQDSDDTNSDEILPDGPATPAAAPPPAPPPAAAAAAAATAAYVEREAHRPSEDSKAQDSLIKEEEQEEDGPKLPFEGYTLRDLKKVVESMSARYEHLLSAPEKEAIQRFRELPLQAQQLYARLLGRKWPQWIQTSGLGAKYRELGVEAAQSAVEVLAGQSQVSPSSLKPAAGSKTVAASSSSSPLSSSSSPTSSGSAPAPATVPVQLPPWLFDTSTETAFSLASRPLQAGDQQPAKKPESTESPSPEASLIGSMGGGQAMTSPGIALQVARDEDRGPCGGDESADSDLIDTAILHPERLAETRGGSTGRSTFGQLLLEALPMPQLRSLASGLGVSRGPGHNGNKESKAAYLANVCRAARAQRLLSSQFASSSSRSSSLSNLELGEQPKGADGGKTMEMRLLERALASGRWVCLAPGPGLTVLTLLMDLFHMETRGSPESTFVVMTSSWAKYDLPPERVAAPLFAERSALDDFLTARRLNLCMETETKPFSLAGLTAAAEVAEKRLRSALQRLDKAPPGDFERQKGRHPFRRRFTSCWCWAEALIHILARLPGLGNDQELRRSKVRQLHLVLQSRGGVTRRGRCYNELGKEVLRLEGPKKALEICAEGLFEGQERPLFLELLQLEHSVLARSRHALNSNSKSDSNLNSKSNPSSSSHLNSSLNSKSNSWGVAPVVDIDADEDVDMDSAESGLGDKDKLPSLTKDARWELAKRCRALAKRIDAEHIRELKATSKGAGAGGKGRRRASCAVTPNWRRWLRETPAARRMGGQSGDGGDWLCSMVDKLIGEEDASNPFVKSIACTDVGFCADVPPPAEEGKRGGPRLFTTPDLEDLRVEDLAMRHYFESEGFTCGVHSEGSLLRDLFGIILFEEIFDSSIDGVFVSKFQDAPLDIGTEVFYTTRKTRIDARIEFIESLGPHELRAEVHRCFRAAYGLRVHGVAWQRYCGPCGTLLTRSVSGENFLESEEVEASGQGKSSGAATALASSGEAPASRVLWICCPSSSSSSLSSSSTSPPSSTSLPPKSAFKSEDPMSPAAAGEAVKGDWPDGIDEREVETSSTCEESTLRKCPLPASSRGIGALAGAIGGKGVATALRCLCEDYTSSGLPDLILWKWPEVGQKETSSARDRQPVGAPTAKFVEVKSERDKLSRRQRLWLAALKQAGVAAEVCHVRDDVAALRPAKKQAMMPGRGRRAPSSDSDI